MFGVGRFFRHTIRPELLRLVNRNRRVFDTIYKFSELNTRIIDREIAVFSRIGVDPEAENKIIVSLTSFPQRIHELRYTLYSLLSQTLKPQKILLWLAKEQFPGEERDICRQVLQFREHGLEICWTHDTRSYKKLVPALRAYPDNIIVTADDDIFYPEDWLERLYTDFAASAGNGYIHAHRVNSVQLTPDGRLAPFRTWPVKGHASPSFLNFITGCAGTLFPPGSLHADVLDEERFLRLAPLADDVFFWAMAVMNESKIKQVPDPFVRMVAVNPCRESGHGKGFTLLSENVDKGGNDRQIAAVLAEYPAVMEKLAAEWTYAQTHADS